MCSDTDIFGAKVKYFSSFLANIVILIVFQKSLSETFPPEFELPCTDILMSMYIKIQKIYMYK